MNIRRIMFLNCFWLVACGETLASMSDIGSLVSTEESLLELLNSYILVQEKEIIELKRAAEDFSREAANAKSHASRTTVDPVSVFKITRRLVRNWNVIRNLVTDTGKQRDARRKWRDIERIRLYPGEEDLEKAATALVRFQDVHKISTSLANGAHFIGEGKYDELTAADCLELGERTYNQLDYQRSTEWLNEALVRYGMENVGKPVDKTNLRDLRNTLKWKIYDFLPLSIFYGGDRDRALNLTREIISEYEEHEGAWNSQEFMTKIVGRSKNSAAFSTVGENRVRNKAFSTHLIERYKLLCRGDIPINVDVRSELNCRYVVTSPFTKLARLKEEEVYLNPRIVVFRNVLHDSEIESIKQLVTPKLARGAVFNLKTGTASTTSHRIAKQRVINEDESEIVGKIHRHAQDISGMSTVSAEEVNVVNYGLGGYYSLHFDHVNPYIPGAVPTWDGNRVASLLFYLSDVEWGGGTAFPALDLAVLPEKGSVLMWRDLLYNGEGDDRVVHAACPVSKGSKWVITFFLHSAGNELLQPCTLNQHE